MKRYSIFDELHKEIEDFDTGGYYLVGEPKSEMKYKGKSNSKGKKGGYYYSQKDTLESIDLASASKFKKGTHDAENQRKTFLNIVNFYRDVMKMKININAANYIFEPRFEESMWPTWFMGRRFAVYAQEQSYDDQIDEYGHDLATYGSTMAKKCHGGSERVPLRTLRITQSAKSAWHATSTGGYVLIEDDKHYNEMAEYPDWQINGMAKTKSYSIFERWALVPARMLKGDAWRTNEGEINDFDETNEEMIPAYMVLAPEDSDGNNRKGKVLFMERVDEESFQLEECHAERVDGRWLGRGEIEKQLENQIARNLTANLRRRGLLWATKKIYQSSDDEVQSQLLMEVKDGEVVYVKPNGTITQVNTSNQHLGEFTSDENSWKENSQQLAFAFNIATGENMPSGTSFSLGVVLDKAVSSHFSMVRNKYSSFLKRSFFDQIMPIFQDEMNDEHVEQIPLGSEDIDVLREQVINFHVNARVWDALMHRKRANPDELRAQVTGELDRSPWLFVHMPENYFADIHYYMRLNIDDDIGPDIQTLTSVWQTLEAKGDPRADNVLKKIMMIQGRNLAHMTGGRPAPRIPAVNPQQAGTLPGGASEAPQAGAPMPTAEAATV